MNKNFTVAILLALAAFGCQPARDPGSTTGAPQATGTPVVANMKTRVFEAQSSRRIAVTPGTTITPIADGAGAVHSITLARDNGGITLDCRCPGGCTEGDGLPGVSVGCIVAIDANFSTCGGNCTAPNRSCMGCSFSFPPPSDAASAALVKDLEVLAEPNPTPSGSSTTEGPAAPQPNINSQ